MNREEFCQLMYESRKQSGVKIVDICFSMKTLWGDLRRFEVGKNNFNIEKLLTYLSAINYQLVIHLNDVDTPIISTSQLLILLTQLRKSLGNKSQVSKLVKISRQAISNVENNVTVITIDYMLDIFRLCDIKFDLEPADK